MSHISPPGETYDHRELTHYEVLGLPEKVLDDQRDHAAAATLVKRAYRRALLRHHPDKAATPAATATAPQQPSTRSTAAATVVATLSIDRITEAFSVLSDRQKRAQYDQSLRAEEAAGRLSHNQRQQQQQRGGLFQTGVENVDLDDLEFEAGDGSGDSSGSSSSYYYYRGCRCGNEQGYLFGEADLEDAADHGELLVGCQDCSLWLRVHFAVVSDDEDDHGGGGDDHGG